MDPSRWLRGTLYPQKLALTLPTSGGRSVGVVCSRTQATEFFGASMYMLCSRFLHLVVSSPCLTNYALRHVDVWGGGCIDPRFLDLGTSWRWVISFTPLPLYPWGKNLLYTLNRRLGGPQSRSWRYGEVRILDPTETRTPIPRPFSSLPIATAVHCVSSIKDIFESRQKKCF
jgi:hypothetical protein